MTNTESQERRPDKSSESEPGPKWGVQKGECGPSLKWTVTRKWTIRSKVVGFEPNWTVI